MGIPFALPYFAALNQILKADFSACTALLVLAGYNLLYGLAFAFVPILTLVLGEQGQPLLKRASDRLDRAGRTLMALLFALIGLALVADAACYFESGEALF